MTPEPPLLSIDGASKRFVDSNGQTVDALQAITLSVQAGEFVSIVGPSGCGKTTLLRLIAGLETPTAGRILFARQPVSAPSPERGMVFQAYTAFPWLTVRENIGFGLRDGSDGPLEARTMRRDGPAALMGPPSGWQAARGAGIIYQVSASVARRI